MQTYLSMRRCGAQLLMTFPRTPKRGNKGFALIVTLSLMILLTVIAVGLLSLASVELRSSSGGNAQATARASAMLALNLALGELQKSAGADQRVTARADILDTTDPTKSKWCGVWDTTQTLPAVTWLVSGPTPIANTGAAQTKVDTTVQLVGKGSTDLIEAGNEIIVPMQDIKNSANKLTGKYGWWVGDEGVKARINLNDPNFELTTTDARIAREAAPGGTTINKLTQFATVPVTNTLNQTMTKVLSDAQLRLASPTITQVGLKIHFHDTSTFSQGLLANVREGGLKRDLSRALYDSPSPVAGRIYTDAGGIGPDWDIARSWASLKVDTTSGFPTAPVVQPHREKRPSSAAVAQHGVAPLISRFGIEWWARIERLSGAAGAAGSTYTLGVGARPVLQITNPYNVRLPAKSYRLSFNFGHDGGANSGVRWQIGAKNIEISWPTLCGLAPGSNLLNGLGVTDGSKPWFHFTTPSIAIEPGQTLLFMPSTANWAGAMSADAFIPLALGENTGGGVLRFPITPDLARTVTYEELNAPAPNSFNSRFGENRGPNWNAKEGRNFTMHLTLNEAGDSPSSLVANLGEALARIERKGTGKFEAQNWATLPRDWAQAGNTNGKLIQTADYYLGNETVAYNAVPALTWMRDFNPRFPFTSDSLGRPLVNDKLESDPQRYSDVWALRYGHAGWQTSIDPMEFPAGGTG
ncbi:MAG: hypothetical protein ABI600_13375, partial [Luteolibacter sp.]